MIAAFGESKGLVREDGMIERVVVLNDDAAESGGAAGIALRSVRLLAERGIPVTILNGSGAPDGPDFGPGVSLQSLGGLNLMQGDRAAAALRGLYSPEAERFVARWIDANDTPGTVYHLHNWHKVFSPSVFRPLRRVADRLLMTAHDYFLVCPTGGQFDFQAARACERVPLSLGCLTTQCDRRHYGHKLWRAGRDVVRRTTIDLARTRATVVAVHDGMVPDLVRGGVARDRIAVIRNPVTPWRAERVRAEENHEFLFVGRLEKDKGIHLLAAAAAQAGAILRIVGDGPLRDELSRTYPGARMMGWRNAQEIAAFAARARVLVVPTTWRETFGLVTLEATMSGLPVLISRHALISDEVERLGCARTCDPYDVDGLAAALVHLASDDAGVRSMSERGFEAAPTLAPTPAAWCDALIALYDRTLRSATSPEQLHPPAIRPAAPGVLTPDIRS